MSKFVNRQPLAKSPTDWWTEQGKSESNQPIQPNQTQANPANNCMINWFLRKSGVVIKMLENTSRDMSMLYLPAKFHFLINRREAANFSPKYPDTIGEQDNRAIARESLSVRIIPNRKMVTKHFYNFYLNEAPQYATFSSLPPLPFS